MNIVSKKKKFYKNRYYAIGVSGKSSSELLFKKDGRYIKKAKEPFFLWIDSFEPHEPWCPTEKYGKLYQKEFGLYVISLKKKYH